MTLLRRSLSMGEGPGSAGHVLSLLRAGPLTRSELAELTGQARSTVVQRLESLQAAGLVCEASNLTTTGGRPSVAFEFDPTQHAILSADLGIRRATFAVTTLAGEVLSQLEEPIDIAAGPGPVLGLVAERLRWLGDVAGMDPIAVGIGLPGSVDRSGLPVAPPNMPGWDGTDVRAVLSEASGLPAFAANDANVLALGERAAAWPDVDNLMYVHVGTGIGAGIVADGRLLHGAEGAAGDLGHIFAPGARGRACRCGNVGCLDTYASGAGVLETLRLAGSPLTSLDEVLERVAAGDADVAGVLRDAGRVLGDVVASCVALLNPRVVVVGGRLGMAGEALVAGVREAVYARVLPLASRELRVTAARSGSSGGVIGAALLAADAALSGDLLESRLRAA